MSLAPTLQFPKFPFPSLSANLQSIFSFPFPFYIPQTFSFYFPTFLFPSLPSLSFLQFPNPYFCLSLSTFPFPTFPLPFFSRAIPNCPLSYLPFPLAHPSHLLLLSPFFRLSPLFLPLFLPIPSSWVFDPPSPPGGLKEFFTPLYCFSDQYPGHPDSINSLLSVTDNVVLTGCEDGSIRAVHLFPHRFIGNVSFVSFY